MHDLLGHTVMGEPMMNRGPQERSVPVDCDGETARLDTDALLHSDWTPTRYSTSPRTQLPELGAVLG